MQLVSWREAERVGEGEQRMGIDRHVQTAMASVAKDHLPPEWVLDVIPYPSVFVLNALYYLLPMGLSINAVSMNCSYI